jgi:hypothetical protein
MNHLSGMDAMFLHIESPEMPMHIGSLNVLDLPPGYTGDFYEDAKKMMSERLHLAAVFTRKLELMPFDLSDPVWVEDEDIDIDYHVRHVTLPKPGTNRQLQQYVARLHSTLLDRSRPLWEVFIIDGLKNGQVGAVHQGAPCGHRRPGRRGRGQGDLRPGAHRPGSSSRRARARATTATNWASRSWPAPPPATRCGSTPS